MPPSLSPAIPPASSAATVQLLSQSAAGTRRAALTNVISALETDWVRDYLLCIEGATEAAILASPLQQLHAMSFLGDASHASVEGRDLTAEFIFRSTIVIVPAFSCDGHTAGAVIEDCDGQWDPENKLLERGFRRSRYVMNETTGSWVGVTTSSESNRIQLFSMQQCNTRVIVMQCFVFNSAQLRNLIGHTNSLPAFENALEFTMSVTQTRSCPTCGAPGTFECKCPLWFRRAKNSLDFATSNGNLISQFGSYEGFGFQETFVNGRPTKTVLLGTSWNGVHIAKQGSSKRLLSWAIANSLSEQAPKVDRYRPFLEDEKKPECTLHTADAPRTEPVPDDITCLNVSEISPSNANLDSVDMCMGSFDFCDFPSHPAKHVGNFEPKSDETSLVTFDDLAKPWESLQNLPPVQQLNTLPMPQIPQTLPPSVPLPVEQSPNSEPNSSENVSSSCRKPLPKAVPIAPLVMHKQSNDMGLQNQGKVGKNALELRQLRAYQRKIRNRESAARSNLARKKRKEMQKLEIAKKQAGSQSKIGSAVS